MEKAEIDACIEALKVTRQSAIKSVDPIVCAQLKSMGKPTREMEAVMDLVAHVLEIPTGWTSFRKSC